MRKEEFAEVLGEISEKHILEARVERKAKKPVWVKWGAMVACLCLVAVGIWHSNIGTPTLPPTVGEQASKVDMPNNTMDTNIETNIGNTGNVDTTIWLSAAEVLQSAENDTKMGVAAPLLVAYQGTIYGCSTEEYNKTSQYALLETEVILRKNHSYPAYQIKDVADNVAIVINGKLEIYQKLFEVKAVINSNPYRIVQPMMSGIDYSYGEIIQENDDYIIYQAINEQSGEVMETEYVINILPLLKRELPNFFDSDENYGDAWWVAVPCSNG